MKLLSLAALVSVVGITPVFAQATSEGQELAGLTFVSVDSSGDGLIDTAESHIFGEDMFLSLDADENAKISEAEFLSWDFGFESLAEDQGKELAYRTALRIVFGFWDRNGDGEITHTEQRVAVNRDFRRADLNGDAMLSEEEFFRGFSIPMAIRIALSPEATE